MASLRDLDFSEFEEVNSLLLQRKPRKVSVPPRGLVTHWLSGSLHSLKPLFIWGNAIFCPSLWLVLRLAANEVHSTVQPRWHIIPGLKDGNFQREKLQKRKGALPWAESLQHRTSSHATNPPSVCTKAEENKSDNGVTVPSLPATAMAYPSVGCAGKQQADIAQVSLHWPASPEGLLLPKRPWSDDMTVVTSLFHKTERGVWATHPPWLIRSARIQRQWYGSAFWLSCQPFAYCTRKTAEIGQESAVP